MNKKESIKSLKAIMHTQQEYVKEVIKRLKTGCDDVLRVVKFILEENIDFSRK